MLLRGNTAFDEDGGDLTLGEEANELIDLLEAGFGFCGDTLDGEHFQAVGATKVMEGIVRRDQNALILRDGGDRLLAVGVQGIECFAVSLSSMAIVVGVWRVECDEGIGDGV